MQSPRGARATSELSFAIVDDPLDFSNEKKSKSPFPPFLLASQLINSFLKEKFVETTKPDMKECVTKSFPINGAPGTIQIHSIQGFFDRLLAMKFVFLFLLFLASD
ncbi:MAG: hypothetical protein NXI00_22880 [Cytophagales bacterium]|nr:hypothetical protein [Cytophagales bacterium]